MAGLDDLQMKLIVESKVIAKEQGIRSSQKCVFFTLLQSFLNIFNTYNKSR